MATRIEQPYTTEFGQVIQPGDKVAVAVLSSKCVRTYSGVYLGYVDGKHKRVQVRSFYKDWRTKKETSQISTLWDNNIFLLERKDANL